MIRPEKLAEQLVSFFDWRF